MEQINDIELRDETVFPDDAVLERVLGPSFPRYGRLLSLFGRLGLTHEWRYYRDGKAWLCKVQKKTRTIVWMSAWPGFMKATVYFPEKDTAGIFDLPLREETKTRIRNTKNVGKSKPCMFDINEEAALDDIEAVLIYKIASKSTKNSDQS
jgi:hypothetical protein